MVCNSGTSLVPTINGTMHHFDNVGLYDALFVMQDQETKTLWNHITGEAVYGPLVGKSLGPVGNLLQLNVEQALLMDEGLEIAISDRAYTVNGRRFGEGPGGGTGGGSDNLGADRRLSGAFASTVATEDTRRPTMELGLGVFTEGTTRYYPMDVIRECGALIDRVDGRSVLIFMDATFTPAAMFVDATTATVRDREVHLDTGNVVRSGFSQLN